MQSVDMVDISWTWTFPSHQCNVKNMLPKSLNPLDLHYLRPVMEHSSEKEKKHEIFKPVATSFFVRFCEMCEMSKKLSSLNGDGNVSSCKSNNVSELGKHND